MSKLGETKDSILTNINTIAKENSIKPKTILTTATQTQTIDVRQSKAIQKDTITNLITILKDTIYSDTIQYNPQTMVGYTIGTDSVSIAIKLNNTQYLYVYKDKRWRYKSFWKRLIRFCWKKDESTKYKIVNSNDLLKTSDVRVVNAK